MKKLVIGAALVWVCGACISAGSHDWESTAYPCPTVTAIHQALGEGE